jgi:GNAT superfamily N-acetyltransferase
MPSLKRARSKPRAGAGRRTEIRAARSGDERRVAELSRQLGYPSRTEQIRRRLKSIRRDPRHAVFVAEDADGRVAGWVHVFVYQVVEADPRAEVGGLVVDEAFRRRGAGRLLMERAERWALELGCGSVSLRSNVVRSEAHRFYENLGYRRVKTQHAFRKSLRPPRPSARASRI